MGTYVPQYYYFGNAPAPRVLPAVALNLFIFTVIPEGYETGTTVKKVKFFISCGYPLVPAGYCSKKKNKLN